MSLYGSLVIFVILNVFDCKITTSLANLSHLSFASFQKPAFYYFASMELTFVNPFVAGEKSLQTTFSLSKNRTNSERNK